jgi:hypothetical protein
MSGVGRHQLACRRLSALSTATALLFSNPAQADDWTGGLGVFFGYAFGAERSGFEWGLEGHATYLTPDATTCSSEPRIGVGLLLQFAFVGREATRLTLAAHGGAESDRNELVRP